MQDGDKTAKQCAAAIDHENTKGSHWRQRQKEYATYLVANRPVMHQHRIEQIHQRDKHHEFDQQNKMIKIGKSLVAFVNPKENKQPMHQQRKTAKGQDKAQPRSDAE